MRSRKRVLLVLAALCLVLAVRHYRAWLTEEERPLVGTWVTDRGSVWELQADRTFISHHSDHVTGEQLVREFRWAARSDRLFVGRPYPWFPLLYDPTWSRWYVFTEREQDRVTALDMSGVPIVLTRQVTP